MRPPLGVQADRVLRELSKRFERSLSFRSYLGSSPPYSRHRLLLRTLFLDGLFIVFPTILFLHTLFHMRAVEHPLTHSIFKGDSAYVTLISICSNSHDEQLRHGAVVNNVPVPPRVNAQAHLHIAGNLSHLQLANLAAGQSRPGWLLFAGCDCADSLTSSVLSDAARLYKTKESFFYVVKGASRCNAAALLVQRADLFRAGGFDERLPYAAVDKVLYTLLERNGVSIRELVSVIHAKNETLDSGSLDSGPDVFDAVRERAHDTLLDVMPERYGRPPNASDCVKFRSHILNGDDEGEILTHAECIRTVYSEGKLIRISDFASTGVFGKYVLNDEMRQLQDLAYHRQRIAKVWVSSLQNILHSRYAVPRSLSAVLSVTQCEKLLEMLGAMHSRGILVVEPAHGLGNRLRALGSALAFANRTRRVPVILWRQDAHCGARLSALFEKSQWERCRYPFVVVEVAPEFSAFAANVKDDVVWDDWIVLDDMTRKGEEELDLLFSKEFNEHESILRWRHLYVRSKNALPKVGWGPSNSHLGKLTVMPDVQYLVKKYIDEIGKAELANAIGVHVRSRKVEGEVTGADYGRNATDLIRYWRGRSKPDVFSSEMRRIATAAGNRQGEKQLFVIAADSVLAKREVAVAVSEDSNVKLFLLNASCESRSEPCVQEAFAQMIVLSHTKMLLASPWSSFSEGVARFASLHHALPGNKLPEGQRLGTRRITLRVAGIDFAAETVESVRERFGPNVAEVVSEVYRRRNARARRRLHSERRRSA